MRIEKSSGLSKDEIDKMTRDAESHAADDKKKRELAEARNQADSLCFQVEKLLKENDDQAQRRRQEAAGGRHRQDSRSGQGSRRDAVKYAISELERRSMQSARCCKRRLPLRPTPRRPATAARSLAARKRRSTPSSRSSKAYGQAQNLIAAAGRFQCEPPAAFVSGPRKKTYTWHFVSTN